MYRQIESKQANTTDITESICQLETYCQVMYLRQLFLTIPLISNVMQKTVPTFLWTIGVLTRSCNLVPTFLVW